MQLYDITTDVREERDVAAENPQIVAAMWQAIQQSHTDVENPLFRLEIKYPPLKQGCCIKNGYAKLKIFKKRCENPKIIYNFVTCIFAIQIAFYAICEVLFGEVFVNNDNYALN